MKVQDVTSSDESPSLLESETRYLPLSSELSASPLRPFSLKFENPHQRPVTAPPVTNHNIPRTVISGISADSTEKGKQTNIDKSNVNILKTDSDTKYTQYDNRPAKPTVTANRRLAAKFNIQQPSKSVIGADTSKNDVTVSSESTKSMFSHGSTLSISQNVKPIPSDSNPQSHIQKRPASPTTRGYENFEQEESDVTDMDECNTDTSQANLELKLLKALVANKQKKVNKDKVRSRSSQGSSPQKKDYSQDKYSPSTRKVSSSQDRASREQAARNNVKMPVATNIDNEKTKTLAATKLQAVWRGFLARNRDPFVMRVQYELRQRRSEQHIKYLNAEVERQKHLYEQEKQSREIHLEALKLLWKQVQSLQDWRTEVERSQDPGFPVDSSIPEAQSLLDSIKNASLGQDEEKQVRQSRQGAGQPYKSPGSPQHHTAGGKHFHMPEVSTSQPAESAQAQQNLEEKCKNLEAQMAQMKDVIASMSSYVFTSTSVSQNKPLPANQADNLDSTSPAATLTDSNIKPVEEAAQFTSPKICEPADDSECFITPPSGLSIERQPSSNSIILRWQHSEVTSAQGVAVGKPIIGYRIYLNGENKGMVAGSQARALIECLDSKIAYKITVRGVSALGESGDSNIVSVPVEIDSDDSSSPEPPDDDSDDSDKDPDSSEDQGASGNNNGGSPEGRGGAHSSEKQSPKGDDDQSLSKQNSQPQDTDCQDDSTTKSSQKVHFDLRKDFTQHRSLTWDSGYFTTHKGKVSKGDVSKSMVVKGAGALEDMDDSGVSVTPQTEDKKYRKPSVLERLENRYAAKTEDIQSKSKENMINFITEKNLNPSSPKIKKDLIMKDQLIDKPTNLNIGKKIQKRKLSNNSNPGAPFKAHAIGGLMVEGEPSRGITNCDSRSPKRRDSSDSELPSGHTRKYSSSSDGEKPTELPSDIQKQLARMTGRRRNDSTGSESAMTEEEKLSSGEMTDRTTESRDKRPSMGVSSLRKERQRKLSGDLENDLKNKAQSKSDQDSTLDKTNVLTKVKTSSGAHLYKVTSKDKSMRLTTNSTSDSDSTSPTQTMQKDFPKDDESESLMRNSRSRASHRIVREKLKDTKKRSSSVGGSGRSPASAKPPINKSKLAEELRCKASKSGTKERARHRSDHTETDSPGNHRNTTEGSGNEHHQHATGDDKEQKDNATKKKMFTHRRSRSDITGQPLKLDVESAQHSRQHPVPPSFPKHACSSPRMKRSSSFSTKDKPSNAESSVRQCISLIICGEDHFIRNN